MQLLEAQTPEQFAQLGKQLVEVRALLHAQSYQLTDTDDIPVWVRIWPMEMQQVFCCPTWNQWMVEQMKQWPIREQQIPLAITNLVKATVFYLRSGELDQLPE